MKGLGVKGLGLFLQDLGLGFRAWGLGFRAYGGADHLVLHFCVSPPKKRPSRKDISLALRDLQAPQII